MDNKPELSTVLFAQATASLLHSRASGTSLSGSHALRFKELKRAAGLPSSHSEVDIGTQSCIRCGTFVIPGWTGQMRLVRDKVGRSGKRKRAQQDQEHKQPSVNDPKHRNRLQWTCHHCGWQRDYSGSDPSSRRKYKNRKHRDAEPVKVAEQIALAKAAESPANTIAVPDETSPTAPPIQAPSVSRRADEAVVKKALPDQHEKQSNDSKEPGKHKRNSPVIMEKQQPRKKRTKKEGLQAMLQARKDSEAKKDASGATSRLSLTSFLQGL